MSRKYLLFLNDMHEACTKAIEFSEGLTYDNFVAYGMPYHAIIRLIEVIGEAAKNIPQEVRKRHPTVEWQRIGRTPTSWPTTTSASRTRPCGKSSKSTFLSF